MSNLIMMFQWLNQKINSLKTWSDLSISSMLQHLGIESCIDYCYAFVYSYFHSSNSIFAAPSPCTAHHFQFHLALIPYLQPLAPVLHITSNFSQPQFHICSPQSLYSVLQSFNSIYHTAHHSKTILAPILYFTSNFLQQ